MDEWKKCIFYFTAAVWCMVDSFFLDFLEALLIAILIAW
jgi:hypothetical protein